MSRREPRCVTVLALLALAGVTALGATARASSLSDGAMFSQTVTVLPLARPATTGSLVMQAHAQALLPAPLPDPDIGPPAPSSDALASEGDPSLQPNIFNPHDHFAGDGYAAGSNIEGDHNNRHTPGGGMSLSIPMP